MIPFRPQSFLGNRHSNATLPAIAAKSDPPYPYIAGSWANSDPPIGLIHRMRVVASNYASTSTCGVLLILFG
jgi:hypothetical protein